MRDELVREFTFETLTWFEKTPRFDVLDGEQMNKLHNWNQGLKKVLAGYMEERGGGARSLKTKLGRYYDLNADCELLVRNSVCHNNRDLLKKRVVAMVTSAPEVDGETCVQAH